MKRVGVCAVVVLAWAVGSAWGKVPLKEDLSGCKLPHGEVVIPSPDSAAGGGAKGTFVRFSDGSAAALPLVAGGKAVSPKAAAAKLLDSGKADVGYMADNEGTLWVLSARAMDLGTAYLHDAAEMKLVRPMEMPGIGGKPAGMFTGIQEGRTFLVETAAGKFALMRILEKTDDGLHVQYVYQPNGQLAFDVPEGNYVSVPDAGTPASAVGDAATEPAAIKPSETPSIPVVTIGNTPSLPQAQPAKPTVLEPFMYTFNEQRKMLIQRRLETLAKDAKSPSEIDDKVQAIQDLVDLHADEAAEPLAHQIAFIDTRQGNKEFSQDSLHPCFSALKKMGHAAVAASLKELSTLDVSDNAQVESVEGPVYRAKLLGGVVRAVEGNDVAEFIFKQERDKTSDLNRKAIYDAVISDKN